MKEVLSLLVENATLLGVIFCYLEIKVIKNDIKWLAINRGAKNAR